MPHASRPRAVTVPFLFGGPPSDETVPSTPHLILIGQPDASSQLLDSDDVLWTRAQAGNSEAFDTLYLRYRAKLWAFAWHAVRNADAAEDIVQDVFVSLWERLVDLQLQHGIKVWLYGAVRNRTIDVVRKRQVMARRANSYPDHEISGLASPSASASEFVEQTDLARAIDAAVDALPERPRTMALLRWREGMTLAEIAALTEVSTAAVHKALRAVERKLRPMLEAYYRESP